MVCFERDGFQEVPGCLGGENFESNTDFCILAPVSATEAPTQEETTMVTTMATSIYEASLAAAATTTPTEAFDPNTMIMLETVGDANYSAALPLGLCQGKFSYFR